MHTRLTRAVKKCSSRRQTTRRLSTGTSPRGERGAVNGPLFQIVVRCNSTYAVQDLGGDYDACLPLCSSSVAVPACSIRAACHFRVPTEGGLPVADSVVLLLQQPRLSHLLFWGTSVLLRQSLQLGRLLQLHGAGGNCTTRPVAVVGIVLWWLWVLCCGGCGGC